MQITILEDEEEAMADTNNTDDGLTQYVVEEPKEKPRRHTKGREANPRKVDAHVEEVVETSSNEPQIINRLNPESPHNTGGSKTGISAKEAKRREQEGTLGKKTGFWSAKA